MNTRTQAKAREIYDNFIATLDAGVSYSMPQFNTQLKTYIGGILPIAEYDSVLLDDAIWDCKDDDQVEDGLTDLTGEWPYGL